MERLDYQKILREKLTEGACAMITKSEKDFADWIDRVIHHTKRCDELFRELKAYRDAEKQGLLLKLPCKVGDRTYQVVTKDERMKKYGCTCCTDALGSNCDCAYFTKGEGCLNHTEKDGLEIISRGFKLEDFEKYGKTVFLTKEEAEAKLAEMKGE